VFRVAPHHGRAAGNQLRIGIVNSSDRLAGGVENYLRRVIPEIERRGHQLMFICETHAPADREEIVRSSSIPMLCASDLGAEQCLVRLRDWGPQLLFIHDLQDPEILRQMVSFAKTVFYAHNYFGTCISGRKSFAFPSMEACARKFGCSCVAFYHARRCGGRSPRTMLRMYRLQSARLAILRRCCAIVTATEHMRQEYLRHGLTPNLVFSIRHPMTAQASAKTEWTPTVNSIGDTLRLFFIGRIVPEKGGELLFQALDEVSRETGRRVSLDVIGDGYSREGLQRLSKEICNRSNRIEINFRGWCPADQVGQIIADSHLLVVPSTWPEPFGQIGIEAALTGIPCAAFAIGGIPEWLHEGINGHLANASPPSSAGLARAITQCVADEDHYLRLRNGARSVAAEYTLENHVDRLEGIFDSAVAVGSSVRKDTNLRASR
jgi:glycosyltransferase involved in cell wall biosynthesis